MFLLQVEVREVDDISHIPLSPAIVGYCTKSHSSNKVHVLKLDKDERLDPIPEDFLSRELEEPAYKIEVVYSNGYRTFETRLVLDEVSDTAPVIKGLLIRKSTNYVPTLHNIYANREHDYATTDNWWGCYNKGLIMKQNGFPKEAREWFLKGLNYSPHRLELVAELPEINAKEALDNIELPYHHISKLLLEDRLRKSG